MDGTTFDMIPVALATFAAAIGIGWLLRTGIAWRQLTRLGDELQGSMDDLEAQVIRLEA